MFEDDVFLLSLSFDEESSFELPEYIIYGQLTKLPRFFGISKAFLSQLFEFYFYDVTKIGKKFSNQEKEKQQQAQTEQIEEIKNETGATADTNIYEVGTEYDGREVLQVKPEVQMQAVWAGIEKNDSPTDEETNSLWSSKPTETGIWISPDSPFFGKDKMATFESYFVKDKEMSREEKNPYYTLTYNEDICDKILKEFNLDLKESHIVNGHMPVKAKDGESPIRGNGKLLVIDRWFCKKLSEKNG